MSNHILLMQDFPYHGISEYDQGIRKEYPIIKLTGEVVIEEPVTGRKYRECCVVKDTEIYSNNMAFVDRCDCSTVRYMGGGKFISMFGHTVIPLFPEYDFNHLREVE